MTLDFSKVTIKLSKFLSASPPFNAPPPPTIPPDQLKKLKAALLQTNTSDLNITNSPALSIVTKDATFKIPLNFFNYFGNDDHGAYATKLPRFEELQLAPWLTH